MTMIYKIGDDALWAGETLEIGDFDGAPVGWTRAVPPELKEGQHALWAGGWIVVDAIPEDHSHIEALRTTKITDLTAACQATILGGFTSGALGTPHQYPSQFTDQINLMGSVTESLLPDVPEGWVTPFWCADEGGVWLMRLHSAEQIRHAGRDGKAHVLACQQVLDALVLDAGAAETAQAIADIVWPGTA